MCVSAACVYVACVRARARACACVCVCASVNVLAGGGVYGWVGGGMGCVCVQLCYVVMLGCNMLWCDVVWCCVYSVEWYPCNWLLILL